MRVAVLGATGVIGRHLVPRLFEAGHSVLACARGPVAPPEFRQLHGITYASVDILCARQVSAALDAGLDVIFHLATSIPKPGTLGGWEDNDRIRRVGTCNILQACQAHGIPRYVQQSIAMLVPSEDEAWVDEDSPVRTSTVTASAFDMEESVRRSSLDWRIVRGGLLYGPGTGREVHWARLALEGRLDAGPGASAYASLIHVADFAEALMVAATRAPSHIVVNAVDDAPVRYAELFAAIQGAVGGQEPVGDRASVQLPASFRARNRRAWDAMGWRPLMRSFRSGLLPTLSTRL